MMNWRKYPYLVRERTTNFIHDFKDRECYNCRDIYNFFVELKRNIIPKKFIYNNFREIHQEYNKLLKEAMLEGEVIKPPYITGSIFIKRVRSIYTTGPYIIQNHKINEENKKNGLVTPSTLKLRWGGSPKWMKPNFKGNKKQYCFKATKCFKQQLNKLLFNDKTYYLKLLENLNRV